MTEKLTKRLIDTLAYAGDGTSRDIRWDTDIPGFGIRLYPSEKKAFVLSYRQNGTKRLFTIGQYGKITLEQARVLAQKKLGEVADGQDPLLKRQATKKKHEWSVSRAFDEFMKKQAKPNIKVWPEINRIFKKDILPVLGRRPIDEVEKDDVLKIINQVMDRNCGIMANKTLAVMSIFFNWCVQRGVIKFSPTYQIKMPAKKRSRDRVLADYELKEIWQACEKTNYPYGPMLRFLILTGQRRGEVAAMTWDQVDVEAKIWDMPREMTKSDRAHRVPLSDTAIALLNNIPKMGEYIFSSTGDRPFENFSRARKLLDAKLKKERAKDGQIPITPWTLHDLRRTCASGMARMGISPHIVEKVLNHSSGTIRGVAAIYNRYEYADEMRDALDQWAAHIGDILVADMQKSILRLPKTK